MQCHSMRVHPGTTAQRRRLLLLLLCAGAAKAADQDLAPDLRADASIHAARLRGDILSREVFDRLVQPMSDRPAAANYSAAGCDVHVNVRFFKVRAVRPSEGKMELKVWVRMSWHDARLAWNASEYGGITYTYFHGEHFSGAETSEIWLPDMVVYNNNQGFGQTLEPAMARVDSAGHVYYARTGTLDVLCKFSGLVAFPYDTLKCSIELGGWTLSGLHQGVVLDNGGASFSSQERTAGASYQEFVISRVSAWVDTYEYACCPGEPWPVAQYEVVMERASAFYMPLVILPGIVVTFLSFAVFFTDTSSVRVCAATRGASASFYCCVVLLCPRLAWPRRSFPRLPRPRLPRPRLPRPPPPTPSPPTPTAPRRTR